MKKLLVLILAAVSCSSLVLAAPVNSKLIPAEAKAVFHLDFDVFRASPYMGILKELKGAGNPFNDVVENLGFNPVDELLSLTMYADSFDENMAGVVIAQAKSNVLEESKIVKMIKEKNETVDISSTVKNGNKIYSIGMENEGQKADVCFLDANTMMAGINSKDLTSAIKTCKSKSGKYSDMAAAPAGSILSINVTGLGDIEAPANDPQAQMMKDVNSMSCFVGETEGDTFISAKLSVTNAAAAEMLQGQLSGMLQFAFMSVAGQVPEMMQYMENIKVLADGDAVNISFKCPSESIVNVIKNKMATGDASQVASVTPVRN